MNYNIQTHIDFDKKLKSLSKKYPSIKSDIIDLIQNLEKELQLADDLGNGFKKIRLNIKSKGKGKNGGGRVITYETIINTNNEKILFAFIYDKAEYSSIDLDILKKNLGL